METVYTPTHLFGGYPAKSARHGALGWSSVTLLRSEEASVLVDTGPPAYAFEMPTRLEAAGVTPGEVTHVLVTHAHWDHLGNVSMFPQAEVVLAEAEYEWAKQTPPGHYHVADLQVRYLDGAATHLVSGGDEALPGIEVIAAPGHTPGSLAYLVHTSDGPLLFAGDACKNRVELSTARADLSLDSHVSAQTLRMLRETMLEHDATMIPGHDVPLRVSEQGLAEPVHPLDDDLLVSTIENPPDTAITAES